MARTPRNTPALPDGQFPIVLPSGQPTDVMREWMRQMWARQGGSTVDVTKAVYLTLGAGGDVVAYPVLGGGPTGVDADAAPVGTLPGYAGSTPVALAPSGVPPFLWTAPGPGTVGVQGGYVTLTRGTSSVLVGGPAGASVPVLRNDVLALDWRSGLGSGAIGRGGIGHMRIGGTPTPSPLAVFFPW